MKRNLLITTLALLSACTTNAATAQTAPSTQPAPQAPPGYVLVDEQVVYFLASEPQLHLIQAASRLAQRQNKAAAQELRITATFLDMQGSTGTPQDRQQLNGQANDLRRMADQVEKDTIPTIQQLRQAFSQTNVALARHFQNQAQNHLKQNQYVRAGYELEAAANTLRQAVAWSGQTPRPETVSTVRNTQQIASDLIEEPISATTPPPAGNQPPATQPGVARSGQERIAQANQAAQNLGQQITDFNTQLQSEPQPAGEREEPSSRPGTDDDQESEDDPESTTSHKSA